jgi:hypothetical protein
LLPFVLEITNLLRWLRIRIAQIIVQALDVEEMSSVITVVKNTVIFAWTMSAENVPTIKPLARQAFAICLEMLRTMTLTLLAVYVLILHTSETHQLILTSFAMPAQRIANLVTWVLQ